jgi:hypothetical protein
MENHFLCENANYCIFLSKSVTIGLYSAGSFVREYEEEINAGWFEIWSGKAKTSKII